jgi:hypothetical protein
VIAPPARAQCAIDQGAIDQCAKRMFAQACGTGSPRHVRPSMLNW